MLKRKLGVWLLIALAISLSSSHVFANSILFNVIVPKLGGSANTNAAQKSTTTQQWEVWGIQVGNNYTVSFRPYNGSNGAVGSWVSGTTGTYINAPYSPSQPVGALIYLKIKNKISTLVNVQVSGYFYAR